MDTPKVLGQLAPGTNSLEALYSVPANARTVVSTIKVCNRDSAPSSYRVTVAVAGAAHDDKQYLYYDVPIDANDTFSATEGWTIGPGDVVRVQSENGLCSFNLFGVEVTP